MTADETDHILTIRSRSDLRDWLAQNHARGAGLWLATFKKPHPDHVPYPVVVEELLCWGWIDAVSRKLDAERGSVRIAPRNPRSAWSAINKGHVARAVATGAMTPAGLALVTAAKSNGMWDFLDDVDRLDVPGDLVQALDEAGQRAFWDALPPSLRRGTLEWIKSARAVATRTRRIADVMDSARAGLRPSPFRR